MTRIDRAQEASEAVRLGCSGISVLLCGLFVYSGTAKLMQPYAFLSGVYSYGLFSRTGGLLIASFLPPLEVVVGVTLLSSALRRGALAVSVVLSACFLAVRSFAVHRGLAIDCNCLGSGAFVSRESMDWFSVGQSGFLLATSAVGLFLSVRHGASNESLPPASGMDARCAG